MVQEIVKSFKLLSVFDCFKPLKLRLFDPDLVSRPARQAMYHRAMAAGRIILHVDMDAFFASVEQRDNPQLRGKPLLVGGAAGRGVVTAASYEARKFGCRSAMPMAQATRLCPQAIVVRGRHGVYSAVSKQVMTIFESVTPDVQPVSIDEAYLDCSGVLVHHGFDLNQGGVVEAFAAGHAIAAHIRHQVKAQLQLTCSVGVAGNKFVAKVASDLNKPDGLCIITPDAAEATLGPLPIGVLRGVGPHAAEQLARFGVTKVYQLRTADENLLASLRRHFGTQTDAWQAMAHGHDERTVHASEAPKSLGKEQTFGQDMADLTTLEAVLMKQAEHVCRDMRAEKLLCRTVTVKIRTGDFATVTRSITLERASSGVAEIWPAAHRLLLEWARNNRPMSDPSTSGTTGIAGRAGTLARTDGALFQITPLRLLGISLHHFTTEQQLDLFTAPLDVRHDKLDKVADAIAAKFGPGTIGTLRGMNRENRFTRKE